jgi:hypothetical protein
MSEVYFGGPCLKYEIKETNPKFTSKFIVLAKEQESSFLFLGSIETDVMKEYKITNQTFINYFKNSNIIEMVFENESLILKMENGSFEKEEYLKIFKKTINLFEIKNKQENITFFEYTNRKSISFTLNKFMKTGKKKK